MELQANKDLVRTMIAQVWNAGQVERLPDFFASQTRDEAAGQHQMLSGAFPDLHVEIEDMVAEADRVVTRLTFTGTHRGPFRDIAPTGRRICFGAIRIYRLAGSKVAETWAYQDSLGLVQQLRG